MWHVTLLPPDAIWALNAPKMRLLGELTALPRPHSCVWGDRFASSRQGRGGEGKGREGRKMEGKWTLAALRTDRRPFIWPIPVAVSADAEVWPSYCVVVRRTYLFVWCQFLMVLNYNNFNLFWGSYCIATNKMCNWRKGMGWRQAFFVPFLPSSCTLERTNLSHS